MCLKQKMSLPRLTRALRAFADVSPKFCDPLDDNDDLSAKCKCQAKRRLKDTISWQSLMMLIHNGVLSEKKACSAKLQQILHIAREIGMCGSYCVYMFIFCLIL